ncbi:uncharacterized protein LOC118740044 [Rhagoletis pomonella]|uniref:uncharacterized protein LOC118740044 n=1 Tax=Rhagoletis pomonella TaxID=28610 RepID=UPI0017861B95|nr:uncharacterized protein LOC118740044 [Rhagoletis pomonella]
MDGKKKKARQRNRPKNKGNRSNNELRQNELKNVLPETTKSGELNVCVEENLKNVEEQRIIIKEAIVEDHNGPGLTSAESQVAPPQAMSDQNNSLQLLQQMMRTQLLQERQNSEDKPSSSQSEEVCKRKSPEGSNLDNSKECGNTTDVKSVTAKKSSPNNSLPEQGAFITNLQKKLEASVANGSTDLPNTLLENLQKLLNEGPLSDVESSDDEDYVEYVFKPRQHFLVALCNFCKNDLTGKTKLPCCRCNLVYYCMVDHMKCDVEHRQACCALKQVADNSDGHIFRKCGEFTAEQFRSYRIVTIRTIESIMNRPLSATEQEVILFPRICCNTSCREYDFKKLVDCEHCGQAAYCSDKPEHLTKTHNQWCQSYQLFKEFELIQARFGQIEPTMPTKILRDIPSACCNTKQILSKLDCAAVRDPCEFAALSQISTCPLTAWYALKLCGHLKKAEEMTVHLIGAEIEFEVDAIHKWEIFFLHINPTTKKLNVVFVGPELNQGNVPFAQLMKTK